MGKFMKLFITLLCAFSLFDTSTTKQYGKKGSDAVLVIWDVGQGQWVTLVTPTHCFHFDMGGEFFPKGIKKSCLNKMNEISLTHWDRDHIFFIFRFKRKGFHLCVRHLPRGEHSWKRKIKKWSHCSKVSNHQEVFIPDRISQRRNENSLAFLLFQKVLITGDAPAKEEREIHFHSKLGRVQFLVAGHHGSRTSTSSSLLSRLKNLKLAVASARFEKYGHPHPQTRARLKIKKVPLLSTNDWGNLMIEL